ncbi:BTAD domain-containing putative transcriptional regulator [Nakamurella sp.]|uniref:BTAD domain-containing putative transcriptional regulator n=1 Tax=Nakamurella sp. TaxID=1869182 RepID=UPI003B3BB4ED
MTILGVGLLGPVVASVDGRPVPVSSARQAAILACLALQAPRLAGTALLIDAVWGDEPPARAEQGLQQHVSTLRGLLEPGRQPRTGSALLRTEAGGYRLRCDTLDVADFLAAADAGARAAAAGQWARSLAAFDDAVARWRGPALSGIWSTAWFDGHRLTLTDRLLSVREDRIAALIGVGRAAEAAADAGALLTEHPLREQLWAHLMRALAVGGRTADALAAYGRARRVLNDELGLEPGAQLRALERDILTRSPGLGPADAGSAADPITGPVPAGGRSPEVDLSATFRSDGGPALPWLLLPDGQIVVVPPGTVLRIGRHPDARIRLADSRVSRWHAEIAHHPDGVRVRDLGSTNGTTVDGLGPAGPLADGAVVSVGGVLLTFHG